MMGGFDRIVREIEQAQLPKHDAVICRPQDASRIQDAVSRGVSVPRGSNYKFRGLEIISLDGWTTKPILCQKEQVFPIAKNWKDSDR